MQNNFYQNLTRIEKTLYAFLWIVIGALLINGVLMFYFYRYYQTPSVTWSETHFPLAHRVIQKGDPLEVSVQRCSKGEYNVTVIRQIVDTFVFTLEKKDVLFEKGCVTETRLVPEATNKLSPGVYFLRNRLDVPVSWLYFHRTDSYTTRTESFTIVK